MRRMRLGMGVLAAVMAAGSSALVGVEKPIVLAPAVEKLNVVRTWEDLGKEPTLTAGDFEVHVGMEAGNCKARGAVLVYCRVDKAAAGDEVTQDDGEALGPLMMKVIRKDRVNEAQRESSRVVGIPEGAENILFVASAQVGEAGEYEVELSSQEGVLAKGTVTAEKEETESWTGFRQLTAARGTPAAYTISEGGFVPRWEGSISMSDVRGELPRYMPEKEDEEFHISADGKKISLDRTPGGAIDMRGQTLARFWVNGKPATMTERGEAQQQTMRGGRRRNGTAFELRLTPEQLGARPEDKVEMQLLFARDGYVRANGLHEMVQRAFGPARGTRAVYMSNRVQILADAKPAETRPADGGNGPKGLGGRGPVPAPGDVLR